MVRSVTCPGELSAGRIDVFAARLANGRDQPALHELVAEAFDGRLRRAAVLRSRKWIERNEIELGRLVAQQLRELARVFRLVVDAVEHHVFERHAAAVLLVEVVPAGLEQLGDVVLAVDRHELAAQLVVRRVQRHGERAVHFFGQLVDLRHQARGATASRGGARCRSRGRREKCGSPGSRCGSSPAARPCP